MAPAVPFAPNVVINIMQTLWLDRGCELSQAIQTILKGEIKEKKKNTSVTQSGTYAKSIAYTSKSDSYR